MTADPQLMVTLAPDWMIVTMVTMVHQLQLLNEVTMVYQRHEDCVEAQLLCRDVVAPQLWHQHSPRQQLRYQERRC